MDEEIKKNFRNTIENSNYYKKYTEKILDKLKKDFDFVFEEIKKMFEEFKPLQLKKEKFATADKDVKKDTPIADVRKIIEDCNIWKNKVANSIKDNYNPNIMLIDSKSVKDEFNKYLDEWNKDISITLYDGTAQEKILRPADRDELTYTDTISLIINVIDTMITIVTTALVIFTSLSLVVSSFMIAVITYISVMERVKEIGVIRSLGGRKKDVSRLFIAENLVTGFFSGVIGLAITGIACIVINVVVRPFGVPAIAVLNLPIIGIMLALSVVLSVLSCLIPSMHASRQDPVIALRSE